MYRHTYPPVCPNDTSRFGVTTIGGEERTYKIGHTVAEYTPWLKNYPGFNDEC